MHNKHGRRISLLYGYIIAALLLVDWAQISIAQAQELTTAISADDPDDSAKVKVISAPYTLSFSLVDEERDKYIIEKISCNNGSGSAVVANEQHVCEGLHPCTKYTAVVTLKPTGVEDAESLNETIAASTDYKAPRSKLTSLEATAKSIQLTWETSDRACVRNFEISAVAPDNTLSRAAAKDESSYTFEDAWSCRIYNVTLETKNIDGNSVDKDTQLVETLYSEPGELTLSISNRTNGETRISWNEPDNKSCIGNYTFIWRLIDCIKPPEISTTLSPALTTEDELLLTTVDMSDQYGPRGDCEWEDFSNDSTLKQYPLTDLQGCALHSIEVYINKAHNGTPKAVQQFTAAEKLPSAITQPEQVVNATELRWLWSVPSDHSKCVANYRVNITGPIQRRGKANKPKLTNETFVVFSDLEPCGNYDVEIVPIAWNGSEGAKYQGKSSLSEDQPSQILDPTWILTATSIKLSWQTPSYADLCISGYRLSGWMDVDQTVEALSLSTSETTVLFDKGLMACQAYTIQIIPFTLQNLDGELRQVEVETKAALLKAEKITLDVVTDSVTSHSLELNAKNKDFDNNCNVIFANFSCITGANVKYPSAERFVESHRDGGFQALLAPLSPNTQYLCTVRLYNVAGYTERSTTSDATTARYFPDQPQDVNLTASSSTTLTFAWRSPTYPNGRIQYYQTFLMRYEADYFVPSICAAIVEPPKTATKGGELNSIFIELSPAVKYIMQVAAQNEFGLGQYTAPIIGTTRPDVSKPVTDLTVISGGPEPSNISYIANVTINWTVPCESNGEIERFVLLFTGSRPDQENTTFKRSVLPNTWNEMGRVTYVESNLMPEVNYEVEVSVKTHNVNTLSISAKKEWKSPAGLPTGLGDDVKAQMRVSATETNHPTSSAIVRLPFSIKNSDSGNITYIALLLSQKHCAGLPDMRFDVLRSGEWPKVKSWNDVGGECIYQYQTTPEFCAFESSSSNLRDSNDDDFVFTIGVDKCPDANKPYCNGPLKANTEYMMVVRLFTSSGYTDAALLEFKTDAAIKVTLILISVCSCLLLAIVLSLLVLYVRKRMAWHRDSVQGIEDPFGNVTANNFAIFKDDIVKPEKLTKEFKEINTVALEVSYAASELGSTKNRYADIYPYDKNRVILDIDTEGSDYINASFIDGHSRKKEYIATQGPKPESVMDFWRMILQHNVHVIVQVTDFQEGNKIKCHKYYPYNVRGLRVSIKSKESFEVYDRTELSVVHEKYGLKEKVIHFFFKKWPDHGVPDDPTHLISFVKKVKAEKRPNYSPIVVHCSAGVGRTGTFIGLDLIMQRLKSESKINIFETVKKLRFQRMKMVQTQQQYEFLYECTYELVKHKIPRAGLKLERRPKADTTPAQTSIKKVKFPDMDAEAAVHDAPDPAPNGFENTATNQMSLRLESSGLRKQKDLDSLAEQPERNSYQRPNSGKIDSAI
ncbi:Ptp52F [Drosophila busckii]|uniref:protein-tyrosine-phosphatase n=1 Tax=Drosophila busckii TaxID=30019 RepID=A0A0M4EM11_DROBS|nr:receptor-type tyrosine-protein phosphatase eta [Drosophila busckii]ALC42717.1 Ptp52F [Drosophila busckii]